MPHNQKPSHFLPLTGCCSIISIFAFCQYIIIPPICDKFNICIVLGKHNSFRLNKTPLNLNLFLFLFLSFSPTWKYLLYLFLLLPVSRYHQFLCCRRYKNAMKTAPCSLSACFPPSMSAHPHSAIFSFTPLPARRRRARVWVAARVGFFRNCSGVWSTALEGREKEENLFLGCQRNVPGFHSFFGAICYLC